jgi:hypothetical protein
MRIYDSLGLSAMSFPAQAAHHESLAPGQELPPSIFDKDPATDADNIRCNYRHAKRGVHFYFRNMLLPMQKRFAELFPHKGMPWVFLHGSPHVDNYAKSPAGAAMVDFDRSRMGPYGWDIVRLLVSISLRQKKPAPGLLAGDVFERFRLGYQRGFRQPHIPVSEVRALRNASADAGSTNAYLDAGKKWAAELRTNPLPPNDPKVVALVDGYLRSRGEMDLLKEYFIEEGGRGQGSMGFREIVLVVLAPKEAFSKDRILLCIKQVRNDPDTEWYVNPFPSEADRMLQASELYAPGWEQRPGGVVVDGTEYYVRQISPMNAKIKKMLTKGQQKDFVFAVGTQLGRAHRLSVQGAPEELESHLRREWNDMIRAAQVIRDEIVAAHARYLAKAAS